MTPSTRVKERPLPPLSPSHPDTDRVFFRGFSGVSAQPRAPPRRKKPKAPAVSRSLSLTYSNVILPRAGGLQRIEELYPDFPRCPIYAAVDRSKKRRRDLPDLVTGPDGGVEEERDLDNISQVTDREITDDDISARTVTTEEDSNKMVKSYSANNSPTYAGELDNRVSHHDKPQHHHKKKKHKKKREVDRQDIFTGLEIREDQHKRNKQGKTISTKIWTRSVTESMSRTLYFILALTDRTSRKFFLYLSLVNTTSSSTYF